MDSGNHPSKNRWTRVSSMAVARSHPGVASFNGKIYIIGGGGPAFKSLNSVEIYDPEMQSWAKGTDMPTHRSGMATFVVQDKIYVVGGGFKQPNGKFKFLKTVEIYDPKTDRWETGPDMIQPHDYPAWAQLRGRLYILGGHHPDATEGGPQTDPGFSFSERLEVKTGNWEELPPLPKPRFASAAFDFEGKIFALGGVAFTGQGLSEFDHVEIFDPETSTWHIAPWKLPWSAAAHGVCVIDKNLFVFGGFSGDNGIGDQAARFRLDTHRWTEMPHLPERRAAMGVAVLNGTIYLIGGWAEDRSVSNAVTAYRP